MTIRTSDMIKCLIHLDHLVLCQLHFHALFNSHSFEEFDLKKSLFCPCCNYSPNDHIPKIEKKEYKK